MDPSSGSPALDDDVLLRQDEIGLAKGGDHVRSAHLTIRRVGGGDILHLTAYGLFGFGFGFGVCLDPDSNRLFVGAGRSIRCYNLDATPPAILWDDVAEEGFLSWERLGDVIFMSAELGFGAWREDGTHLWSTFVEPPWDWRPVNGEIELTVMGASRRFAVESGPPGPPAFWLKSQAN